MSNSPPVIWAFDSGMEKARSVFANVECGVRCQCALCDECDAGDASGSAWTAPFVSGIAELSGFAKCVEYVCVPRSVEVIGESCFEGTSLAFIQFASGSQLKRIEMRAFAKTHLASVFLPKSLECLGPQCFGHCEHLEMVAIDADSQVRQLPEMAFVGCRLVDIDVPRSVEVLGDKCFALCQELTAVRFTDDSRLRVIGAEVLSGTRACRGLFVPKLVEQIDPAAFRDSSLMFVAVSAENQHFDSNGAFLMTKDGKTLVTSVRVFHDIPAKIEVIRERAFAKVSKLPLMFLWNHPNIHQMGKAAFGGSGIEEIEIPAPVEVLEENLFMCSKLAKITFAPDSRLRRIECGAFGHSNITTIVIPSNVEVLGDRCFSWCTELADVTFAPGSKLVAMGIGAFEYCNKITTIDIPSSVREIKENCFCECKQLEFILFKEDSQLEVIGDRAFQVSGILQMILPKAVQHIGHNIVKGCNIGDFMVSDENPYFYALENLVVTKSPTPTLVVCTKKTRSLCVPSWIQAIEASCFQDSPLASLDFDPESELVLIGPSSFSGCRIESLSIPMNVQIIENDAFSWCPIASLHFSENSQLRRLGKRAFAYAEICSLSFPASLETIDEECFYQNDLTSVTFPESSALQLIGPSAFANTSILCVSIPKACQYSQSSFPLTCRVDLLSA